MKQKILIVDDSEFMRIIIKNILTDWGYTSILEADSGEQAIEIFKSKKPDLVLLDIIMPGIDGVETLKRIMGVNKKAKVAMVTAIGQEIVMYECKKSGSVDYLTKPFNKTQIKELVKKIIDLPKKEEQ